jgi:hypothetical protein
MTKPYDLARQWLADHAEKVLRYLFPQAKLQCNDYVIGDLEGNPGDSLHIAVKGPKAGRRPMPPSWLNYAGAGLIRNW